MQDFVVDRTRTS